jgi:hypothetical protein
LAKKAAKASPPRKKAAKVEEVSQPEPESELTTEEPEEPEFSSDDALSSPN